MHTQNVKGAALESKETWGNSKPQALTLGALSHYSAHHAAYFNALTEAVADHPYLDALLDELAGQKDFSWNGQPKGQFHAENVQCIGVEIAPVEDFGEFMESITFEDAAEAPHSVAAYSLYARLQVSPDFAEASLLHDADSLAECEFMALLALRCVNRLTQAKPERKA